MYGDLINSFRSEAAAGSAQTDAALFDALASRFRAGGVLLVALTADAQPMWHDEAAPPALVARALPALAAALAADTALSKTIAQLTPTSTPSVIDDVEGLLIAAFPRVDRRKVTGAIALIGFSGAPRRDPSPGPGTPADEAVPTHTRESLLHHASLVMAAMRDHIRLSGLEGEINSLSAKLADTYEELSLIYQISGGMRVNRRAPEFFRQACLDVLDVMGVRGMGVALRDEFSSTRPALYGSIELPEADLLRLARQLRENLTVRKAPLLVNDLSKDLKLSWLSPVARQLIAVPLQRQDQVLGCFFALDKVAGEFDSVDAKLLTSIANECAVYLENAVLFEDVHDLMMGLLHALTSAVDAKDAYTCGHSERVALLSQMLAKRIGLSDQQADRIYMAGLLHDVGKIGVPEAVLQKTGRLTAEEFDQMKKHTEIGARILRDIKQIEDVVPGVLHHHERFDGKGYPAGLAGEAIPLMGRIICLADSLDAMTSNRTYRKGMPIEAALAEVRRCSGTHFDPELAEHFLAIGAAQLVEILRDHRGKAQRMVIASSQQLLRVA